MGGGFSVTLRAQLAALAGLTRALLSVEAQGFDMLA